MSEPAHNPTAIGQAVPTAPPAPTAPIAPIAPIARPIFAYPVVGVVTGILQGTNVPIVKLVPVAYVHVAAITHQPATIPAEPEDEDEGDDEDEDEDAADEGYGSV